MNYRMHSIDGSVYCPDCWRDLDEADRLATSPTHPSLSVWDSIPHGETLGCDGCAKEVVAAYREWLKAQPAPTPDWLVQVYRRARVKRPDASPVLGLLEALYDAGYRTPALDRWPGKETIAQRAGRGEVEPATRVGTFASAGDAIQYGGSGAQEAATALMCCLLAEDGPLATDDGRRALERLLGSGGGSEGKGEG